MYQQKSYIVIFTIACMCFQCIVFAQDVAKNKKVSSTRVLNSEQLAEIDKFFSVIEKGKANITYVSDKTILRFRLFPSIVVNVNDSSYGHDAFLDIKHDGKFIYLYNLIDQTSLFGPESPEVKGKTLNDVIPEEKAFEIAKPILHYYGLDSSKQYYRIHLMDAFGDNPKDLWRAQWVISKEFSFESIPCTSAFIAIIVSAVSGEVIEVAYTPVVPPEKVSGQTISAEQALEAVKTGPRTQGAKIGDPKLFRKVIAPANELFTSLTPPNVMSEQPVKTYVCWEVPFRQVEPNSKKEMSACVYVNIETGKIIGGK